MDGTGNMSIIKSFVLLICLTAAAALFGAPSLADDSATAQAVLRFQIDIETPKSSSSSSATIISPLGAGETHEFDFHGYNFQILVTDRRLNEFTIELSLNNDEGSTVDSTSILVGINIDAKFDFKFGEDSVSGRVRVSQIIEPRKN